MNAHPIGRCQASTHLPKTTLLVLTYLQTSVSMVDVRASALQFRNYAWVRHLISDQLLLKQKVFCHYQRKPGAAVRSTNHGSANQPVRKLGIFKYLKINTTNCKAWIAYCHCTSYVGKYIVWKCTCCTIFCTCCTIYRDFTVKVIHHSDLIVKRQKSVLVVDHKHHVTRIPANQWRNNFFQHSENSSTSKAKFCL